MEHEWLLGFRCSSLLGCSCCIWLVADNTNRLFPDARVHVVGPLGGLPAVVDGLQVLAVQFRLVMGVGMGVTTCGVQHKVWLAAHGMRTENKSGVTFLAHAATTVTIRRVRVGESIYQEGVGGKGYGLVSFLTASPRTSFNNHLHNNNEKLSTEPLSMVTLFIICQRQIRRQSNLLFKEQ